MKTLALTSPNTRGPAVTRVQNRLKHNWTLTDFLQGDVDGTFGPQTARACIRAKYWLGYKQPKMLPIAGDQLVSYLTRKANLPPDNLALRQRRIAEAQQKPLRVKALERAERDLGMKEKPKDSNRCPITERWGVIGPWCAMAASIWYIDAGSHAFALHADWAYVPFFLADAARGMKGTGIITVEFALPGDIVAFDWDDDGIADHMGLLRSRVAIQGFDTIEGNTSLTSDSNGGEVMHRTRTLADVARYDGSLAFVRVGR